MIHGDANDENVLVRDGRISGLLDFGDCIENPSICELAIALAYALLGQPEALESGAEVVAGFNGVRPVSNEELTSLYPLVCARLAVSLTVAEERKLIHPDHPNWFVTEADAWALLETLSEVDPAAAAEHLGSQIGYQRDPIGLSPEDLLDKRRRHLPRSLSLAYETP